MNNKGSTLTVWIFTIIIILTFVLILQTQVLNPMNEIYLKNYTTGLNTSTLDDIGSLRQTSNAEIMGGEVTQTSDGLTLVSAWTVSKGIYQTITSFLNGSFISTLVSMLDLPPILANIIIIMIWISLILTIIYLFMKVVP